MNNNDIKIELSRYYLFERQFLIVTTEQVGVKGTSDVWVMDKDYMSIEIEIKVSKSDLMTELTTIKNLMLKNLHPVLYADKNGGAKWDKHRAYLKKREPHDIPNLLPNRFYFAVPEELVGVALEHIKDTPYGLLMVTGSQYSAACNTKVIKSGKLLHKGLVAQTVIKQTMRRLAFENKNLRIDLKYSVENNKNLRKELKSLQTREDKPNTELEPPKFTIITDVF